MMKRALFNVLSTLMMALFKATSLFPFVGGVGKHFYAAGLFGRASGLYYGKHYQSALKAYAKALTYSKGMEDVPPFSISFEQAYKALGKMYEKGLGVEKDEMKAEEYYLRAGSRGEVAYEHKVATKSWYENNWK